MGVTKRDIVNQVAQEVGLSERKTGEVVQAFLEQVMDVLVEHERLELRGFGVFEVSERKAKKVKHPKTGMTITVPAYKGVNFNEGKALKGKLNDGL